MFVNRMLVEFSELIVYYKDVKSANVQKKERYEKHRNVLVSFFAFAMLVIS